MPVYDGASDLHMDRGAARIDGTAQPGEVGNLGVAGHRDGFFRVLKDPERFIVRAVASSDDFSANN